MINLETISQEEYHRIFFHELPDWIKEAYYNEINWEDRCYNSINIPIITHVMRLAYSKKMDQSQFFEKLAEILLKRSKDLEKGYMDHMNICMDRIPRYIIKDKS